MKSNRLDSLFYLFRWYDHLCMSSIFINGSSWLYMYTTQATQTQQINKFRIMTAAYKFESSKRKSKSKLPNEMIPTKLVRAGFFATLFHFQRQAECKLIWLSVYYVCGKRDCHTACQSTCQRVSDGASLSISPSSLPL